MFPSAGSEGVGWGSQTERKLEPKFPRPSQLWRYCQDRGWPTSGVGSDEVSAAVSLGPCCVPGASLSVEMELFIHPLYITAEVLGEQTRNSNLCWAWWHMLVAIGK